MREEVKDIIKNFFIGIGVLLILISPMACDKLSIKTNQSIFIGSVVFLVFGVCFVGAFVLFGILREATGAGAEKRHEEYMEELRNREPDKKYVQIDAREQHVHLHNK